MEYKSYKVVYRRYASLYVIMGVDSEEVSVVLCWSTDSQTMST